MAVFDNTELDDETIADYGIEFSELHHAAESYVLRLEREPEQLDTLNALFRCVHTIKGNAGLLGIDPIVVLLQELESILHLVRSSILPFTTVIGDVTLLVMDQCNSFLKSLQAARPVDYDAGLFSSVNRYLAEAASAEGNAQQKALNRVLMFLDPNTVEYDEQVETTDFLGSLDVVVSEDLRFVYQASVQAQHRADFWHGRLHRVILLLLSFNERLNKPVNNESLVVAACLHDLSMAFLPASVINKKDRLSESELMLMRQHVEVGVTLVSAFPQWHEVADILLHHHQRLDGTGYPSHASVAGLSLGSQMLAIVHTYEAITHGYSKDVRRKRPLMRAVMELNAGSGTEYQEVLVQAFLSILNDKA